MAKQKTDALAPTTPALAEFNPRDPQTILATAQQLAQFISTNKLASTIQGRSYVQAEGWQFLFAVAGLDVLLSKPQRLERATEVCYEAEARLVDATGREVGYGYAVCSDAERLKKGWAEYAIASMAQTRAIGKAGRNRFAFVMKAAGFEPTPAEEMSEVGTGAQVVSESEATATASAPAADKPGTNEQRNELRRILDQLDELTMGKNPHRESTRSMLMNFTYNRLEDALAYFKPQLQQLTDTGEVPN